MSTWKPGRISDVIGEIGEEKYVLPVIQRSLVWTEEKMEMLFDTLLRGDSFGGVIVIEEEKNSKPLFNFRPFTKDGELIASRQVDKLNQTQNFVIDGQQRLQSFYIGLAGSFNGKVLYFDLYSDFNNEFDFKFENDQNKLPTRSKDNMERPIPEHNWFQVSDLFKILKESRDEEQIALELISSQGIENDEKKKDSTRSSLILPITKRKLMNSPFLVI